MHHGWQARYHLQKFPAQGDATTAVALGKVDAMSADSPVTGLRSRQTGGKLQLVGSIYESAPYGYAIGKSEGQLKQAIQGAVQKLIDNGAYNTICEKWGLTAGEIKTSADQRGDELTMTDVRSGAGVDQAPELIKAVPLRRPGVGSARRSSSSRSACSSMACSRTLTTAGRCTGKYIFDQRISQAVLITIDLTVLSMVFGILLGVVAAVMRLSPNPVLRASSWLYLWFFRGTPVYIQLVFWGLFTTIYKRVDIGIPFVHQFAHFNLLNIQGLFWFAVIGLSLNEGAYMAEIVRAGITSVGEGQTEAAVALGMGWSQTMRRVVLPQAMRVIIPPTGNEVISMLKTTSLVVALPYSFDLYQPRPRHRHPDLPTGAAASRRGHAGTSRSPAC